MLHVLPPVKANPAKTAVVPPVAAARVVVTATLLATPMRPDTARVEPQLNPYHPNHRMSVPKSWKGTLCVAYLTGFFSSKRPGLGPAKIAPINPENPPTMCTTPEPAKSIT